MYNSTEQFHLWHFKYQNQILIDWHAIRRSLKMRFKLKKYLYKIGILRYLCTSSLFGTYRDHSQNWQQNIPSSGSF